MLQRTEAPSQGANLLKKATLWPTARTAACRRARCETLCVPVPLGSLSSRPSSFTRCPPPATPGPLPIFSGFTGPRPFWVPSTRSRRPSRPCALRSSSRPCSSGYTPEPHLSARPMALPSLSPALHPDLTPRPFRAPLPRPRPARPKVRKHWERAGPAPSSTLIGRRRRRGREARSRRAEQDGRHLARSPSRNLRLRRRVRAPARDQNLGLRPEPQAAAAESARDPPGPVQPRPRQSPLPPPLHARPRPGSPTPPDPQPGPVRPPRGVTRPPRGR